MSDFIRGHAIVEIIAGASIEKAANSAIDLAKTIRGTVYFKFNNCELSASPNSIKDDITRRYFSRLEYESLLQRLNENGEGKP